MNDNEKLEAAQSYAKFLEALESQDPELVQIIRSETKLYRAGLLEIRPGYKVPQLTRKALDILYKSIPADQGEIFMVDPTTGERRKIG